VERCSSSTLREVGLDCFGESRFSDFTRADAEASYISEGDKAVQSQMPKRSCTAYAFTFVYTEDTVV